MIQFRYRVRQRKMCPFHLISQLDIARLWDRTLRRSGIPILYSQGFNPRPLLSFGPATPLGVESRAEYLEIFLREEIPGLRLREELNRYFPEELHVEEITMLSPQRPSLMQEIKGIFYAFSFYGVFSWNDISLPEGIEMKNAYQKENSFWVWFFFRDQKAFFSPLKFSMFLEENHGYPFPDRIIKEGVLFKQEGERRVSC